VAEILPKDLRGQILLLLTIAAVTTGYVLWSGFSPVGVTGITATRATRDTLQMQIDTIEAQVRRAKADVQHGTVQVLEERLALYRANLELMRQLVPSSSEMPNLLDDITSRAKMRGATVAAFTPQPVESGSPFDTQKIRFTVTGQFDQVGEFLSDISSLPRIVVPYDVKLERATGPVADSTRSKSLLAASFQVRTFVKASAAPSTGPAAATPPAPPTPTAAPARPRAGGVHD
jgi:type IV pilus assembly protein PilO